MPDPHIGPLTALRRLRHVETDAARSDLGEALAQESVFSARQTTLNQEVESARQVSGEFDREAFAAWLGRARTQQQQLAAAMQDAASRIAVARTTLAQRRVAETAAEDALAVVLAMLAATVAKREQVMLEDAARVLKRAADCCW